MSYAYSFGNPSDAWNQKSLNSPLPCKDGIACQFPKCCVGVHPGEEGTGRKYFPARKTVDRVTGENKTQPPCVRLVGKNKDDIPGFYRRRSKKMSWPQWCAAEGIALPQVQVPQVQMQTPAQEAVSLLKHYLPFWSPPPRDSPIFRAQLSMTDLMMHFGLPQTPSSAGFIARYVSVVSVMGHSLERDSYYLSVLSLSNRFPPDHPLQPALKVADQMLASRLAHQRMIERPAIPAHLAEPTPRTIARGHRQLWGDRLYTAFASYIKKIEPEARANNIWREGFNAGMVTASVLDTIDYESQVDELLSDEKKIEAVVADCLVMYA
jgi:hypothetical protein